MADSHAAQPIIQTILPIREFAAHHNTVYAVAVSGQRMVTGLGDNTLLLWDLNRNDVAPKKMKGHGGWVWTVAISRDGQFIASGDHNGELVIWDGDTGELVTPGGQTIRKAHSAAISSVDFSKDGKVLATGSMDKVTRLWSTQSWKQQGISINCNHYVHCIRYSPSGKHLAIATSGDIQIWSPDTGTPQGPQLIKSLKGHTEFNPKAWNSSLAWTLDGDGRQLLSAGSNLDPTIRGWDTSTWKQVDSPCRGNTTKGINTLAVNPTGTLVASVSHDHYVRLWRLSDLRIIASFKHSRTVCCVTFSTDGKYILSGGFDKKVSQWAVPSLDSKILDMDSTIRKVCIDEDWGAAEELLKQRIDADNDDDNAYANLSFVKARNRDWDGALHNAHESVKIQPSLKGYISRGIALCGQRKIKNAIEAFDLASMFTDGQSKAILLLIKAIALFNAKQHSKATPHVYQQPDVSSDGTLACSNMEVYFDSLGDARQNGGAGDFTAAVNAIAGSSESVICSAICSGYEDFGVLFGWDLKSVWQIANQKRCDALLQSGGIREALESYRYMMDRSDEATKARCLVWSTAFEKACGEHYCAKGFPGISASAGATLDAKDTDPENAIELYSAVINLGSVEDAVFVNRSKAKLEQRLWEDALLDAQKVVKQSPESYIGYEAEHAVLHAAQRYDEATQAFDDMLSKSDTFFAAQKRDLRKQRASRVKAEIFIQQAFREHMGNTPIRLLDTSTGRLYDREAQNNAFNMSTEYKELLSSSTKHEDLEKERISAVVAKYFDYVMLSHRWDPKGKEPLLQDIQDESVYELNQVGGIEKLQRFCETARDAGYRWAWSDTCCISNTDADERSKSINSMFRWYQNSALTIVFLSDVYPSGVSPSLGSSALVDSAWITRGWTLQEFLAPKVILFYRNNWTPYFDHHSHNHKQELKNVTGINSRLCVTFRPGMRDPREKLEWASQRETKEEEDVAYSLFGIFEADLHAKYSETRQIAVGRLLEHIVARSHDISVLDWVGKASGYNSCLPADLTPYGSPSSPWLSEDDIQASVSSLRSDGARQVAVELYDKLYNTSDLTFSNRQLDLPCIAFHLTEVKQRPGRDQNTYDVKAERLCGLSIITQTKLPLFSLADPIRQKFLLVRSWDDRLLELDYFSEDTESVDDSSPPASPLDPDGERALRLIARLKLPFTAFLLAQQRREKYTRIASDYVISAQVKDTPTVIRDMMNCVRTVKVV